ncbi:LolA family protein [Eionea flava]
MNLVMIINNRKYFFLSITVLLLFVGYEVTANDLYASAAPDEVTSERQLLASISPAACHFSGKFSQQKNTQGLGFPLRSHGDFFFSCDLGLVWNTIAPFEEVMLYINSTTSYRASKDGGVERMSGMIRYAIAKIFLKILSGDTKYFSNEFSVILVGDGVELKPENDFLKKGIKQVFITKGSNVETGTSLRIDIEDAVGQHSQINIVDIIEYSIEGRQEAYQQCQRLYLTLFEWCSVLRYPDHYTHDSRS